MTTTTWINGTAGLVLTENHASSAATYTLTPSDGLDYQLSFPDGSSCIVPAAGISLTITSGATMGAANLFAFRLWFAVFNNSGTAVLAVRKCSGTSTTGISIQNPLEFLPASSTTMSSASDNAHVFYSTAGVTTMPWAWVAFATYESGLTTAGTWNASPTTITTVTQLTPRPGTVLQIQAYEANVTFSVSTITNGSSALQVNLTLQSACHFVEAGMGGGFIDLRSGVAGCNASSVLRNITTSTTFCVADAYNAAATEIQAPASLHGYDTPNSTATQTYCMYYFNISGGLVTFSMNDLYAKELMV